MFKNYLLYLLPLSLLTFTSCEKVFETDDYSAYFGGEIINPQDDYVLLLKDNVLIDSIKLDENNRFFKKFDSLAPGLYTFKHKPEYQYVYFDRNDSLMIRLNTSDFDNTLSFCGKGDEKNNFLIELFLKNYNDNLTLFEILDNPQDQFITIIDSLNNKNKAFYTEQKQEINWSEGFDKVAMASLDFNYFYKKELYPYAHKHQTGSCVLKKLPKDFYNYREKIDYDNTDLANFSPFIKFISVMLNNITYKSCKNDHFNEMSLENNIKKLHIADSIIKNQQVKNVVLNNIAYMYLLEDQNMYNNKQFIDKYLSLSTDKLQQKEVSDIFKNVQNLKVLNQLPKTELIDINNNKIDVSNLCKDKETVVFFWTTLSVSHLKSVHRKVKNLKEKYPNIDFIAININDTNENWKEAIQNHNLDDITEYKSTDFEDIKKKWVITKIHRTIILNKDGSIKNAFANLFDANFEKEL